jgi:hypothetical protein
LLVPKEDLPAQQIYQPITTTTDIGLPQQTPYVHALKLNDSSNRLLNKTEATPEMRLKMYNSRQNMYRSRVRNQLEDQSNINYDLYTSVLPENKRPLGRSLLAHITREKLGTVDKKGYVKMPFIANTAYTGDVLRSLLLANLPIKEEIKPIIDSLLPKLPDAYKKNKELKKINWENY